MNLFSYFVTFDWLKCSSRIGEWLNVNKYQPKNFLTKNSFLNFYRKNRHDKKALQILNYPQVTEQWIIGLFDLVFFCCKINRFFEYLDSIISIKCLPFDKYLIENAKNT